MSCTGSSSVPDVRKRLCWYVLRSAERPVSYAGYVHGCFLFPCFLPDFQRNGRSGSQRNLNVSLLSVHLRADLRSYCIETILSYSLRYFSNRSGTTEWSLTVRGYVLRYTLLPALLLRRRYAGRSGLPRRRPGCRIPGRCFLRNRACPVRSYADLSAWSLRSSYRSTWFHLQISCLNRSGGLRQRT